MTVNGGFQSRLQMCSSFKDRLCLCCGKISQFRSSQWHQGSNSFYTKEHIKEICYTVALQEGNSIPGGWDKANVNPAPQ